ncbi:hypothetical protein K458DRAFT_358572 [Lentithecium fluviatile CBS 122367]|uniref:Rhodopsin domain-containing protein n=1 Tax=Lentithecium fluviatile CBS 122367 TaxID=1168545 RepID=A0A6G1JGR7_9PLEO|nr:hypothetical protein K458DRAFT_358572 [Lentithecium fluviatile CBS 122367]
MSAEESLPTSDPAPPSHPFVTADDHTSLLNVVGWFSVVVIVMTVLTRLGTRWAKSRTVGLDDGAIITSTIFAIAQTVAVSMGVNNGLGRSAGNETDAQLIAQQKSIYAFTIFFILGQFFAKLSIISFVIALTPFRSHQAMSRGLIAMTCIWMLASVFGFAFQCDLPDTWKFVRHKCADRVAFYTFVESYNIVLDTALSLLPSVIIFGLQIDAQRKVITIIFFMSRLLVVAASLAQFGVIYSRKKDPFLSWTFALLIMIIQTLSIVTACGPYLKPFLDSVNSGLMGNDDIRRRQGGTGFFMGGRKDLAKSCQQDEESELRTFTQHQISGESQTFHTVQVSSVPSRDGEEWEAGSQSSRAHIIRQTTTYRVSSETCE